MGKPHLNFIFLCVAAALAASCSGNDGQDDVTTSQSADPLSGAQATLSFKKNGSPQVQGRLDPLTRVQLNYDIRRLGACAKTAGTDIEAFAAIDKGTAFALEEPTQRSNQRGYSFILPNGKDLSFWFHARGTSCESWDSQKGANYHFAVQPLATIHFDSSWNNWVEGSLSAGKDFIVDYDRARMPVPEGFCDRFHHGVDTLTYQASYRFDGGDITTTTIYGEDHTTPNKNFLNLQPRSAARIHAPNNAAELELWFYDEIYGGSECRRWDSDFGRNFHFGLGSVWTELGAGSPVRAKDGVVGVVVRPSFVDAAQPLLATAAICQDKARSKCRPASSFDGGATWVLHDAAQFADIETYEWNWWMGTVARSAARTNRIYFSAGGHPWDSAEPKGGLWRSDDNGQSWTQNLMTSQPGESGLIPVVIPDPHSADKVYIHRGYDYGNVSVSRDAGKTFKIVCGDNNTEKTVADEDCGSAASSFAIDFASKRFYFKHHFISNGSVRSLIDGTFISQMDLPGVGWSGSGSIDANELAIDLPIRGLKARPIGGHSFRFTADASAAVYLAGDDRVLYRSDANFTSGTPIQNATPGGNQIVLTHPIKSCTWVVQSSESSFLRTLDCGTSWKTIPSAGMGSAVEVVSAAFDPAGRLVVFTLDGRRFSTDAIR